MTVLFVHYILIAQFTDWLNAGQFTCNYLVGQSSTHRSMHPILFYFLFIFYLF
jgi:hypothetical protein